VKSVSGPGKGKLTVAPDGSNVYKPRRNFRGTVSFTYSANDGTTESAPAVVTIRVLPVRG
jgi:hypothetical protein